MGDVCSGVFVVLGRVEGGGLAVVTKWAEVWVSAVGVVEYVEFGVFCGLAVVLFGVSSKSARGERGKGFTFPIYHIIDFNHLGLYSGYIFI